MLLLCAVGVTKLMKMSRDSATQILWKYGALDQQVIGQAIRLMAEPRFASTVLQSIVFV